MPANIVVNIAGEDPNPGHGNISFRDALAMANSDNQANTITFAPGITTIMFTDSTPLDVTEIGQANETTIDGGGVVVLQREGIAGPVLDIGTDVLNSGPYYAQLRGLTLTGGVAGDDVALLGVGGGLFVGFGGHAALDDVTVRNNNGGLSGGGGIGNLGVVSMDDCTVIGNSTDDTDGGGIYNGGQLDIVNSTVAGNTAGGGGEGGGIYDASDAQNPLMELMNCTVSSNTAGNNGGGIYAAGATALTDVTITGNRAVADFRGNGPGGGLYVVDSSLICAKVTADNTIISGNFTASSGTIANDIAGPLTAASSHNLIGGNASLGPLANNRGTTETVAPLPGSPAIDAGDNALAVDQNGNALTIDQRGFPRVSGQTVDIGAYELQQPFSSNPDKLVVAGSGPGGGPLVNVYNAQGRLTYSFLAFAPNFTGGVHIAVGKRSRAEGPEI